jgi:HK97 family phage major capsid protein
VPENTQILEQDVAFGQAQLGAYMYTSKIVRVSYQLLQDNAFNLEAWLGSKLGERIARAQAAHHATGTGVAQPQGLFTGAPIRQTMAAGATTTLGTDSAALFAKLLALVNSIDRAYRSNARFVMADSTFAEVYRLLLNDLKYTTNVNVADALTPRLLGYPVEVVPDGAAPGMAASAKSIIFGDIRQAYVVRTVRDIFVQRLAERYADYAQVGFLGLARSDGLVQATGALGALAQSAT